MKKVADLVEGYIRRQQTGLTVPSSNGYVTIRKSNASVPIMASNKWETAEDKASMSKRFEFRKPEFRNQFVVDLLQYEQEVGHNAEMKVGIGYVELTLSTHDLRQVTEQDEEYAAYADVLFRDIVYTGAG